MVKQIMIKLFPQNFKIRLLIRILIITRNLKEVRSNILINMLKIAGRSPKFFKYK